MCPRDLSRPRGRPRASLITDPAKARRDSERACADAQRRYERALRLPTRWTPKPPMQPTCDLDRGLVYARYAGLVHPQAVHRIVRRTRDFEAWMRTQRGARGPGPDVEKATRLFLALETIKSIRQKRAQEAGTSAAGTKASPNREPATREIQETLELLFEETPVARTVRERLKDLKPRLAAFEAERKAARRALQRARRKKSAEAGPA